MDVHDKKPVEAWDGHPMYLEIRGQTFETFTRSALATALNRSVNTIRALEHSGVICHPLIRNKRGWWIYTREQIEQLVELAKEEGVLDPRYRRSFSPRFSSEAKKILKRRAS